MDHYEEFIAATQTLDVQKYASIGTKLFESLCIDLEIDPETLSSTDFLKLYSCASSLSFLILKRAPSKEVGECAYYSQHKAFVAEFPRLNWKKEGS